LYIFTFFIFRNVFTSFIERRRNVDAIPFNRQSVFDDEDKGGNFSSRKMRFPFLLQEQSLQRLHHGLRSKQEALVFGPGMFRLG
jgi:hypothetical protein